MLQRDIVEDVDNYPVKQPLGALQDAAQWLEQNQTIIQHVVKFQKCCYQNLQEP